MEIPIGLKQGIVMARALAQSPRLVLFDEANGGFDSAADARLKAVFSGLKGKTTIIIVSHRPSLLSLADRRFRLIEGRLLPVESGGADKKSAVPPPRDARKEARA